MKITIKHKTVPFLDTVHLPQRFSRPPPPLHLQSMDETALFSGYKSQRPKGHKKEEARGEGTTENRERLEKKKTDFRSSVSSQRNRGG
jgi:hypothetical protein